MSQIPPGLTIAPVLQLAKALELEQLTVQQRALFEAASQYKLEQAGFLDFTIDLSSTQLASGGYLVPHRGFEVSFLRRVSTPGALLQLVVGGMSKPFAPGDRVEAAFDTLTLKLDPGSVAAGTAILRISLQPQARFREFQGDAINVAPIALLGSLSPSGSPSYPALILKDLVPTGAQAGSFSISGWSMILVLIDTTSNGGTATSFDLVPWFQTAGDNVNNVWYEQGTQRISVPDTNLSGGQRRIVAIPLTKAQGNLYLAINNLLAAARTGLLMCVLGVG